MDFNGHIHEGVLDIKETNLANITCFGRNGIGTGRSGLLLPGYKTSKYRDCYRGMDHVWKKYKVYVNSHH